MTRKLHRALAWFILSGLFLDFGLQLKLSHAATPTSPKQIDEFLKVISLEFQSREKQLQRGAVLITHKDRVVYKKIFGHKKNKQNPIDESTLFPLASVSKPFAAMMMASLAKQGKLTLDDSVGIFAPGMSQKILLKHALSHSSGYTDTFGNKAVESNQDRGKVIQLFSQQEPAFSPGAEYSYSNVIFSLLEDLVVQRTQLSFKENMRQFLSQIHIQGGEICHVERPEAVAVPHQKIGKRIQARTIPQAYPTKVCSAAGLFLSIDQVERFLSLMTGHQPQVLAEEDLYRLFLPQVEVKDIFVKWQVKWPYPIKELKSYYGLGWRTLEWIKEPSHKLVFHSGHLNGITTFVGFLPGKDLGIAVLSNQDRVDSEDFGFDFWKYSIGLNDQVR